MKGSCLCGAVAYEAPAPAGGLRIGMCSCRFCRKAHAAAFNVYATVPRANFRWLRGQDKTSVYESSPGKNRHFCSVCPRRDQRPDPEGSRGRDFCRQRVG